MPCKIIKIPKRNGKFRTIYIPDAERKAACRKMLQTVMNMAWINDSYNVQHGFTEGRSPVTNALAHVGWAYTLCMDLKDFFDTVTPGQIKGNGLDDPDSIAVLFEDGAARQGLPTSPAVANLAAAPMDDEIMDLNQTGRFGSLFIYTRYADDLTFSFNLPHVGEMLRAKIPEIVRRHGFALNESKTRLASAKAGRRHITGVAVDYAGVHPTREIKRRLRAARHQLAAGLRPRAAAKLAARQAEIRQKEGLAPTLHGLLRAQARGLEEWRRLRPPSLYLEKIKTPNPTGNTPHTVRRTTVQPIAGQGTVVRRRFSL